MLVSTSGPEDGQPVVFLPGAMVAGWMWTQQARDLADFRCLIPDLPGFDAESRQAFVDTARSAHPEALPRIQAELGDALRGGRRLGSGQASSVPG